MTLVHSDVLTIKDLPGRLATYLGACTGCSRLKVVANIPYNITTGAHLVRCTGLNNIPMVHCFILWDQRRSHEGFAPPGGHRIFYAPTS